MLAPTGALHVLRDTQRAGYFLDVVASPAAILVNPLVGQSKTCWGAGFTFWSMGQKDLPEELKNC